MEGENLEYLWDRAFEEGHAKGRRETYEKMDGKLEAKYNEGYEKGIEESKVKYFGMGLEDGRKNERAEWIARECYRSSY